MSKNQELTEQLLSWQDSRGTGTSMVEQKDMISTKGHLPIANKIIGASTYSSVFILLVI